MCVKMRTLLGIVLCISFVNLPFAKGQCGWSFSQTAIDDTAINTDIFNHTLTEDFEFESWEVTSTQGDLSYEKALTYFKQNTTEKTFYIQTTDYFGNLNDDAYTDGNEKLTLNLVVTLKCGATSENSSLLITIQNTNQNAPEFSQESYTYSLPMPIMPKTDFSLYGDEISATDIDFSTTAITYSIDPEDFSATSTKAGNKTFQAVFRANKILRLTESQIYTLTATDSGTPPKSTSVKITLNVDETTGLDSPTFSSTYYTYNYTSGDTPSLVQTSGNILIQSDKPNEATYALSGEYFSVFDVDFTNSTKIFTITLKTDASLPEGVATPVVLTLSYKTDVTVNAVLLIAIVQEESVPEFSSDYYVGSYGIDTNKISWNKPIAVTGSSSVEVSGDKSSLFTLNPTTFELTLKNPLSTSDFDENSNLLLTLIASSTAGEARATVIIALSTPDELKFNNVYYYGSYSIENEKGVVTLDTDIGFADVSDLTGITIVVDNSYSSNFKFDIESTISVTVLKDLNSTILANTEIAIPIIATKTGDSATTKAILILKLPEKVDIKFSNPYYTAKYVKGSGTDLDSVNLDGVITIEGAEGSETKITFEGYNDNFEVEFDSDSSAYKITVKKNLNSSILQSETELIITITAANTDESSASSTALVLKLPEIIFNFESKHYAAEYIVESPTASVKFIDENIKITGADSDEIKFTFEGYSDNFEMKYNTASSDYDINVKTNLNSSILEVESQLIITITAEKADGSATTTTVVVLKLPEKVFNFESKHYAAEYIVGSPTASVKFIDENIKITGADSDEIKFTFEGYNDNFEMKYNTASSAYDINVKTNLNSSILEIESQLIITITAEKTDGSATTTTVVVLKLPEKVFNFESKHYAAEYIVGSPTASVKFIDENIKITGADSDEIKFTFEGYSDNFEMKYNTASSDYDINVKTNLNSSILEVESQLIITITAEKTDGSATTTTVVVLKLPEKVFNFESKHYAAEYIVGSPTASVKFIDENIKITGADSDEIKFTFEGYNDNFEMKYNTASSAYDVNVKTNLNSSILDVESQLIITITAEKTDGSATTTVVVLKLPEKVFNFESKHYAAEYIVESPTASVKFIDENIKITGADSDEIKFTFEGYSDIFEMKYNAASSAYDINVKTNLNSSILDVESQLIFTITAEKTDGSATTTTVVVLKLPEKVFNFESKHYAAEYSVESPTASVKFIDENMKITGADSDEIKFTFEGYNDNFEMKYDTASSAYDINVKTNLNSSILDIESQLIITITAEKMDGSATTTTVVVLKLPEKVFNFENKHYSAEYTIESTTASVKFIDESIKITGANSDEIKFTFEGYNDNFEMKYDTASFVYEINVKNSLNSSILDDNIELIVTITADKTDSTTSTILVLKLPEKTSSLNFDNKHYAAEYNVDAASKATVKFTDHNIKLTGGNSDEVKFSFEGYNENFELTYNPDSSIYEITVTKNLDTSILASESQLIITISAAKTDASASGNTVLILNLPEKTSSITFNSNYYAAEYTVDSPSKASVKILEDSINIAGADPSKMQFLFEGYNDNFELVYDSGSLTYNINVKGNLNSSVLNLNTQLVITIAAATIDGSATGTTVLVLQLPEISIAFEEQHYTAKYTVISETEASVQLDNGQMVLSGANSLQLQFSFEGYNDNFEMKYNTDSTGYEVVVKKSLNSSILDNESQLIVTITAEETESKATTSTILVLKLPEKTSSLNFDNKHYAAEYQVDAESKATVTFTGDNIKITGANSNEIQFTFEGYNDNFEMTYNSESSIYEVTVANNLDPTILASEHQLIITISAAKTDASATGNTVLILKLPEETSSLIFNSKHYAAEYIANSDSTASVNILGDDINIAGADSSKIQFIFEGYNDNFALAYDSGSLSYKINVKGNLNSSVLNLNTQLVITIAAATIDGSATGTTVLVLQLPETSIAFEEQLYTAKYTVISQTEASVQLDNGQMVLSSANSLQLQFSFEGYNDNFEMKYNTDSTGYEVVVKKSLNSSILDIESQLIVTITAEETESKATTSTILVLKLPEKTSSLNFDNKHYAAEYQVDAESKATVTFTGDNIKITGVNSNEIQFTFEGYNDNFEMTYNSESSIYEVTVSNNLDPSILASEHQLIITISAAKTDASATGNTVLILKLPEKTSSLIFNSKHYAAEYIANSDSTASVNILGDDINIAGADSSKMQFIFEGYNDNFALVYDSDSLTYKINVKGSLNSSVLNLNAQLVITIAAATIDGSATGTTVLVLQLPEISIAFEEEYYTAEYIVISQTEASVQLNKNIAITGTSSLELQFSFEGYQDYFDLQLNSTTSSDYNVISKKPLDETILSSNTHLVITVTATSSDVASLSVSTVLVLKLPSNKDSTSAFENDYYVATYKQSGTSDKDKIEITPVIKIKNAEFAGVALSIEGYEDNFVGTCDSGTLECTITVKNNLNSSTLSSNTELLLTLTASYKDGSSTGKTVLLVKLPSSDSTFSFTKQHYFATYTIEKTDNGKATVDLNDTIAFEGAESSELTIDADEYSDKFGFSFDSKWNLIVNNNLDSTVLSSNTELIISLTATRTGKDSYSKATLVIKLPDRTTMAFAKPQYSGEYIDNNGIQTVVLTDNNEIETTDTDVQITLDSFTDNFEVILDTSTKWTINVKTPLSTTVFTENRQLKLLMTITKIGVTYGEAALVIKLPDPSFSKGFYSAEYSNDNGGSISSEAISIVNVEAADIQVNLSKYNEYFYTDLVDSTWVVKLSQALTADITQHTEILLTTLEAIRKSDSTQLATSTLVIKLPDVNSTGDPLFKQFTFLGEYKNSSDTSSVVLTDFIGFNNPDTIFSIIIEEASSKYSTNFKLNRRDDGTYDIEVSTYLSDDVLNTETSIVLTLVASTQEGNTDYAALVITLPKTTREISVQFKDEEILYTGTYDNGTFKSPSITIQTNSTDNNQISVDITNDLGVDKKYFKSTYQDKILSVNVDDLPDDILKKYTVIPLKLAITDKDTGDTVYAVLNVNINYNSNNNGGGGDDDDSDSNSQTGLIAAVIVLAILLIAVIIATILFWYFKIRNNKYSKMDEEEVEKPTPKPNIFTKNLTRQTSTSVPSNSALRRPTGLPISFIDPESPTEDTSSDFEVSSHPVPVSEPEKKVVFDEHVQNIDAYDVDEEEPSENLQNVADRRPTQFVFAYPMEAVLDSPTERRESSDYIGFDPEKKKSVVFDENVERMDIDVVEDEDNDSGEDEDKEKESYDINNEDDLKRFKSELEVKLEEQLEAIEETL